MSSQVEKQSDESLQDPHGFPLSFENWTRKKVEELAKRNEIGELTENHWKIIDFVHDHYTKYGRGPSLVKIARHSGLSSKVICSDLFPCGVVKGAYLLAGLPRPAGCI